MADGSHGGLGPAQDPRRLSLPSIRVKSVVERERGGAAGFVFVDFRGRKGHVFSGGRVVHSWVGFKGLIRNWSGAIRVACIGGCHELWRGQDMGEFLQRNPKWSMMGSFWFPSNPPPQTGFPLRTHTHTRHVFCCPKGNQPVVLAECCLALTYRGLFAKSQQTSGKQWSMLTSFYCRKRMTLGTNHQLTDFL